MKRKKEERDGVTALITRSYQVKKMMLRNEWPVENSINWEIFLIFTILQGVAFRKELFKKIKVNIKKREKKKAIFVLSSL